jgi:hypothetical protein
LSTYNQKRTNKLFCDFEATSCVKTHLSRGNAKSVPGFPCFAGGILQAPDFVVIALIYSTAAFSYYLIRAEQDPLGLR